MSIPPKILCSPPLYGSCAYSEHITDHFVGAYNGSFFGFQSSFGCAGLGVLVFSDCRCNGFIDKGIEKGQSALNRRECLKMFLHFSDAHVHDVIGVGGLLGYFLIFEDPVEEFSIFSHFFDHQSEQGHRFGFRNLRILLNVVSLGHDVLHDILHPFSECLSSGLFGKHAKGVDTLKREFSNLDRGPICLIPDLGDRAGIIIEFVLMLLKDFRDGLPRSLQ